MMIRISAIVMAAILGSLAGAVAVAHPLEDPCHCAPDDAFANYGCSDTAVATGSCAVLQGGECPNAEGCVLADCKWLANMYIKTFHEHHISLFVSATLRSSIDGTSWDITEAQLSSACGSYTSLAFGYDNNICSELIMECETCGS